MSNPPTTLLQREMEKITKELFPDNWIFTAEDPVIEDMNMWVKEGSEIRKELHKAIRSLATKLVESFGEIIPKEQKINTDFKIFYVSKDVYTDSEINSEAIKMAENYYFNSAWVLGKYSRLNEELEVKEARSFGLPENAIKEIKRYISFTKKGIDRGLDYVIFAFNSNNIDKINGWNECVKQQRSRLAEVLKVKEVEV